MVFDQWKVCVCVCVLQVRKYRTMTELIVDAIEFVKNPYKGKKLKVRSHPGTRPGSSSGLLQDSIRVFLVCLTLTRLLCSDSSRFPQEAADAVFSLLHGKKSQIC